MREHSRYLFALDLPKGYSLHESVGENGKTQTSLSFPFAVLSCLKAFAFARRFAKIVSRVEKLRAHAIIAA